MRHQLLVIFSFIALVSCDPKVSIDDNDKPLKFSYNDTLSIKKAVVIQDNYHQFLNSLNASTDSLPNHGWISVDDLDAYVKWAKKTAKSQKKEVTGYRIYFAKHNDEKSKGNISFFIAPTGVDNVKSGWFQGAAGNEPINDPDLQMAVLNYINTGLPPKKIYPFEGQ